VSAACIRLGDKAVRTQNNALAGLIQLWPFCNS